MSANIQIPYKIMLFFQELWCWIILLKPTHHHHTCKSILRFMKFGTLWSLCQPSIFARVVETSVDRWIYHYSKNSMLMFWRNLDQNILCFRKFVISPAWQCIFVLFQAESFAILLCLVVEPWVASFCSGGTQWAYCGRRGATSLSLLCSSNSTAESGGFLFQFKH